MSGNFLLSENAVRQVTQLGIKTVELEQRINNLRPQVFPGQTSIFAKITGNVADATYSADQVIGNNSSKLLGTNPPDPITWGADSSDVGYLYAIDHTDGDVPVDSIVPVFQYSDGTDLLWGFPWQTPVNDAYNFLGFISDNTVLDINGGQVQFGDATATVSALSTTALSVKYYWVQIDGTVNDDLSIDYSINTTIQSAASYTGFYTEASDGARSIKYLVGTSGNETWDQAWVGSINAPDPEPGSKGGDEDQHDFEYMTELDDETADQLNYTFDEEKVTTKRGLIKTWNTTAAKTTKVFKAIKWLGIEKGGTIKHRRYKSDWGVFEVDFSNSLCGWTPDGGAKVTGAVGDQTFDTQGHLRAVTVDGTLFEPDPDATHFKYRHCTDPAGNPDVVYDTSHAVIESVGECYQFLTVTEDETTIASITASYADCTTCATTATNQQWKKCADDVNAGILAPGATDQVYAWLCISSVYVKCYFSALTSTTATNPTVLEQCDGALDCADLVGVPASDSFGADNCDSAYNDAIWKIRWAESGFTGGDLSTGGGNLSWTSNSGFAQLFNNANTLSDVSHEASFSGLSLPSGGNATFALLLRQDGGSNYIQIYRVNDSAGAGQRLKVSYVNGGSDTIVVDEANSSTSGAFKITYDGTDFKAYWNGALKYTLTATFAVNPEMYTGGTFTGSISTTISAVNVTKLSDSGKIYIDPTGESCT
jgi:hypothetical protein